MKVVINLAVTVVVMVLLLVAAGALGGIGSVELTVWCVALAVAMAVVAHRSRRGTSS